MVFGNNAGVLSTTPDWSWRPTNIQRLVCEAVMWADVGNRYLESRTDEFTGDGERQLWSLGRSPVQFIDSITIDGERLPVGSYASDPLAAWFSLPTAPVAGSAVV